MGDPYKCVCGKTFDWDSLYYNHRKICSDAQKKQQQENSGSKSKVNSSGGFEVEVISGRNEALEKEDGSVFTQVTAVDLSL